MKKQQDYQQAMKAIQINKIILNVTTSVCAGAASFAITSFSLSGQMSLLARAAVGCLTGVSVGVTKALIDKSLLEEAVTGLCVAAEKHYEEGREKACLTKSPDLAEFQRIHQEGKALVGELQELGTLIRGEILLSEQAYADQMASEILMNQQQDGYTFLLPISANDGSGASSEDRNLPGRNSQPKVSGAAEVIDFNRHLQKRLQKNERTNEEDAPENGNSFSPFGDLGLSSNVNADSTNSSELPNVLPPNNSVVPLM